MKNIFSKISNMADKIKSKPLELGLAIGIVIGSTGLYAAQKAYEHFNTPEAIAEFNRLNMKMRFANELEAVTRQGDRYFNEALQSKDYPNERVRFDDKSSKALDLYRIAQEMCRTNQAATIWQSNDVRVTLDLYSETLGKVK